MNNNQIMGGMMKAAFLCKILQSTYICGIIDVARIFMKVFNWKESINEKELNIVASKIKDGELIVFPTETVYGIGTNALEGEACNKIFKAKGRPSDNPLIVHVCSLKMLKKCVNNIQSDISLQTLNDEKKKQEAIK